MSKPSSARNMGATRAGPRSNGTQVYRSKSVAVSATELHSHEAPLHAFYSTQSSFYNAAQLFARLPVTATVTAAPTVPFVRPFPALTSEQRLYLDLYGYVIIPNTLTPDEVGRTKEALHKLKRDLEGAIDPNNPTVAHVRGAHFRGYSKNFQYIATMYEADQAITDYCCHPRLVGMAEELIGCEARIIETAGIINTREGDGGPSKTAYGFHNGVDVAFGSHLKNGLYHCNFVKTLTNLTDLGPDDGGTVVIAGSHKIDLPNKPIIDAANLDPKMIHQMVAPAGSTLLFSETLIHATGHLRSDRERMIIICGYGPTMFPDWGRADTVHHYPSPEFAARIPESLKHLFYGRAHWNRRPKYRVLEQPVDTTPVKYVPWS